MFSSPAAPRFREEGAELRGIQLTEVLNQTEI
jgi:hypothetical protein